MHCIWLSDIIGMFLLKRICLLSPTDFTDCNNFAIVDASAIGHHGKEDGGSQKEEAEHPQHDPVQGVGENLELKAPKNWFE